MRSLATRVLVAAGAVLVLFLGLTVAALDIAFRNAAERAIRDRLNVQVLALLTAAELDDDGRLLMPDALPEPRFSNPGSGLYAQVLDRAGETVWRSPSTVGVALPRPSRMTTGERGFQRVPPGDNGELFLLGFTVLWDSDDENLEPQVFHFMAAESVQAYLAQVGRFRASLLGWFGLVFAALVGAQLLILRRTLRPLRELAEEVADVEAGRVEEVRQRYPRELQRLARNLNALIRNERAHLRRYRDTLADLAHSLKTPLAVVRGALRESGSRRDSTIEEQVARMDDIVRYQLQRTAALGGPTFGSPVGIEPYLRQVLNSLAKAHADRRLEFETDLDPAAQFRGEPGDLLEILGNLLDNACKWAHGRIRVTTRTGDDGALLLRIDDDGKGIPGDQREAVLARGRRADERVGGYGIGLAVVHEVVTQLGGTLALHASPLGGLRVELHLPG